MMTFGNAVQTCLKEKYIDFNGRARRSEYWWFALFSWVGTFVLSLLDNLVFGSASGYSILATIWSLAILLPSIAVGVRRCTIWINRAGGCCSRLSRLSDFLSCYSGSYSRARAARTASAPIRSVEWLDLPSTTATEILNL